MNAKRTTVLGLALLLVAAGSEGADRQTEWVKRHHEVVQATLPCVGAVTIDVWWQLRLTTVFDEQGGAHFHVHFNNSSLKATDESGGEYTGAHQIAIHVYVPPGDSTPRTNTEISNIRLLGRGSAPDLTILTRLVFTVNAGGEVTVDHQIDRVECSEE